MSTETEIQDISELEDEEASNYYFYYDSHPTAEDLMSETTNHDRNSEYVRDVIRLDYPETKHFPARNLNIYQTADPMEYPVAPDVCLIKNVPWRSTRSWYIKDAPGSENNPPPSIVFEMASDETWKKDLNEKPRKYLQFGVNEYFAYDPRDMSERRRIKRPRLHGWRRVVEAGKKARMEPIPDDERGWKWSEELQSWLQPDGSLLRLRTPDGQLRLTVEEHERAERQRAELGRYRAEAERDQLAELNEKMLRKLRELNIDLDNL